MMASDPAVGKGEGRVVQLPESPLWRGQVTETTRGTKGSSGAGILEPQGWHCPPPGNREKR